MLEEKCTLYITEYQLLAKNCGKVLPCSELLNHTHNSLQIRIRQAGVGGEAEAVKEELAANAVIAFRQLGRAAVLAAVLLAILII